MKFKKTKMYVCPYCNSEDTQIGDYEFDVDCLWIEVICSECHKDWSEYALLQYDGYSKDGVSYDKEGEVIET